MVSVALGVTGIFGALVGSFLNVVIYRIPAGRSIVSPPSACPHCGVAIRGYDNIPVISWLVLGGKCRACRAPISVRYPLVELGTAIFFTAVTWRLLHFDNLTVANALTVVAFLYLAAISVALALIDLDTHTLPNAIVLPAYLVGLVLLGGSSVLSANFWPLAQAAIGMAALLLLYLTLALVKPGGMGMGDVKLAGVIGLFLGYLGWGTLIVGAFAAFLLGGVFSLVLVAFGKAGRKTRIPFGPWMLLGAWVGIFAGDAIAYWYLGLFGLA